MVVLCCALTRKGSYTGPSKTQKRPRNFVDIESEAIQSDSCPGDASQTLKEQMLALAKPPLETRVVSTA